MTREEALQAIKAKMDYYESDKRLRGALETLIPELRESEDERIKKIITDSVFYQYGAGAEYKDVLDYLDKPEKQKKQEKKEVKFVFPKFLYARTTNNKTIDVSYAPQSLDAIEYIRSDSLQQEQPDEHYTKRNALFDKCVENCDPKVMKEVSDKVDEMLGKPSCWDNPIMTHEMIMDEQKEQKPVELTRNETSIAVKNPEAYKIGFEDGEAYAREELKQEWGEEDEHRRKDAIYFLESAKRHYADTSEIERTINWLKSLRPSWRPSEEQLVTLLRAEGIVRVHDTKELAADLAQLYEQLKKLKEDKK